MRLQLILSKINAMKKIVYYTVFLLVLSQTKAQQIVASSASLQTSISENQIPEIQPVYFNYSRRQLLYNKDTRINPAYFLKLCRNINDAQVKNQIARYDQLTRNKKILVSAMFASGITGFSLMMASNGMYGTGVSTQSQYAVLFSGLGLLLATPVLAISTSIPHQKRKQILFRDLPNAYNFYAVSQNK